MGSKLGTSLAVLAVWFLATTQVSADARSDYLARLLQSSTQFRVRAQAAISLGRVTGDASVLTNLSAALDDAHPAVRAAAASSLERLADPAALPDLRKHVTDPQSEVRAAVTNAVASLERISRTRPAAVTPTSVSIATAAATTPLPEPSGAGVYYVGVGVPGTRVAGVDEATLVATRALLRDRIQAVSGVVLAPNEEARRDTEAVLRARRLTGYFIDSSIVSVEERPDGGLRVAVSVIVGTYPGRDMRSILQGAATVMGGGASARNQAIEAAFTGALRNLGQAMMAGRPR